MEIKLKKTGTITNINGVPARVWEGCTESGVQITAFITRIAANRDIDCSELETELTKSEALKASNEWPLRMIL